MGTKKTQKWVKKKDDKRFHPVECEESSSSSSSSSSCYSKKHGEDSHLEMQDPEAEVVQEGNQSNTDVQESDESIIIKESCNIKVNTTENEVALSLQLALQLAIVVVIKILIASSDKAESVAQDLVQHFNSDQKIVKKIYVENSKNATITVDVNEIAVNIQAMLQILLTLVAKVEAF